MRIVRIATLAVMAAALLAGCAGERTIAEGAGDACTQCHGGSQNSTAESPFYDVTGKTDSPQAGAHTAHLARGVACEACHVTPTDTGHVDGRPAEIEFHDP